MQRLYDAVICAEVKKPVGGQARQMAAAFVPLQLRPADRMPALSGPA